MRTKAQRKSVTDNESINDGSMHLIQCTETGPNGKHCDAWTSIRRTENFMDRPFSCGFYSASGFKEYKKSPPSNNADITSSFCADSNEQYGRRDNVCIAGVEEIIGVDVYERVVEVANDI